MRAWDRRIDTLMRNATMAAFLGRHACVSAECGNEELAYHAARMAWKWAMWAAEDAVVLSMRLEGKH